jgi:hypothetical protein
MILVLPLEWTIWAGFEVECCGSRRDTEQSRFFAVLAEQLITGIIEQVRTPDRCAGSGLPRSTG